VTNGLTRTYSRIGNRQHYYSNILIRPVRFLLVGHGLGFCVLRLKPQNVARLARERPADRIERRKADRARLAGLEDREVGQRHSDPIRELGQRHPPIVKQVVKLDGDRHITRSL
jgi:hypothetical protein